MKEKRERQQAEFMFDDQTLYLKYDGSFSFESSQMNITILPFSSLNPEYDKINKEDLTRLLTTDREIIGERAVIIQDYINNTIVPRAKNLWLLKGFFLDTTNPDALNTFQSLAATLYHCDDPKQFSALLKNLAQTKDSDWVKFAQNFDSVQYHLSSSNAEQFAKDEVKLWLRQQGLSDVNVTGSGQELFSDADTQSLFKAMRAGMMKHLSRLDDLLPELQKSIEKKGGFALTQKNEELFDKLLDIPKSTNPQISILFDLSLQDNDFKIAFFEGNSTMKWERRYGGIASYAAHSQAKNTTYLPKKEFQHGEMSISQHIGYELQGAFSILNESKQIYPPQHPMDHTWKEELLHKSIDRLFKNEGLPFDNNNLEEQFLCALKYDLANGDMATGILAPLQIPTAKTGKDILPYLDKTDSRYDHNRYYRAATESIAHVLLIIDEEGMEEARRRAPKITEYIEDIILPLAREKSKEWGVQPTAPASWLSKSLNSIWKDDSTKTFFDR